MNKRQATKVVHQIVAALLDDYLGQGALYDLPEAKTDADHERIREVLESMREHHYLLGGGMHAGSMES